jgi:hypothetical protein
MSDFFKKLMVPTNPEYDFEGDPGQQPDYANPVVLSNKLVMYANATLELTESIVSVSKQRERKRLELRDEERKLQDLKRGVLARTPITSTASKNLQLTDAHIYKALETEKLLDGYKAIEARVAKLEDEIDGLKAKEEDFKYSIHTIKLASDNITNKLSYVKAEAKFAGLGT